MSYPPTKIINLEVNVFGRPDYKVLYFKAVFEDFQCQPPYGLKVDQLRGLMPLYFSYSRVSIQALSSESKAGVWLALSSECSNIGSVELHDLGC